MGKELIAGRTIAELRALLSAKYPGPSTYRSWPDGTGSYVPAAMYVAFEALPAALDALEKAERQVEGAESRALASANARFEEKQRALAAEARAEAAERQRDDAARALGVAEKERDRVIEALRRIATGDCRPRNAPELATNALAAMGEVKP